MVKKNSNRTTGVGNCAWLMAAAGAVMLSGSVFAQNSEPGKSGVKDELKGASSRIRRVTPVLRKPLIDLESQAKSRREGQIMPGDPSPGQGAVIDLPETRTPVDAAPRPVPILRENVSGPARVRSSESVQKNEALASAAAEARPAPVAPAIERREVEPREAAPRAVAMPRAAEGAASALTTEPLPELTQTPEVEVASSGPGSDLLAGRGAVASDVGADLGASATASATTNEDPAAMSRKVEVNPHVNELRAMGSASVSDEPASDLPPVTVLGPARVRVERSGGGQSVQWRGGADDWSTLGTGVGQADGRVEIRGGVDADATFVVEERLLVHVGRLARVVIETAGESNGSKSVHLTLARGKVEIQPIAGASGAGWSPWLARVRTPDRTVALVAPSSVEYDAFSGARIRVLENQRGE